jgi:hypothetical protein
MRADEFAAGVIRRRPSGVFERSTRHADGGKTVKRYIALLAIALVAATPSPKPSPMHSGSMMSHGSMGHSAMMKASPKPSPMHSGPMMSHGTMMKASPKPTPLG